VGLSLILHVVRQSNQIVIKRRTFDDDGNVVERESPSELPPNDVVVLQPYGSLFFAAAPVFESQLPAVTSASRNSVVILRLRGRTDLDTTFMDVLGRYAQGLAAVGSKLVIVSAGDRIQDQLQLAGVMDIMGQENVYPGDERVGAAVKRAHAEAMAWIHDDRDLDGAGDR
jgi:sulfate permease, SulP family